jgi:hypothetical protein
MASPGLALVCDTKEMADVLNRRIDDEVIDADAG